MVEHLWPIGRILSKRDGLERRVRPKTKSAVLELGIDKVVFLEVLSKTPRQQLNVAFLLL